MWADAEREAQDVLMLAHRVSALATGLTSQTACLSLVRLLVPPEAALQLRTSGF